VRDAGQVVRVGRGLRVLGRDDDRGVAGQAVRLDLGDHLADLGVDVVQRAGQQRAGGGPAGQVAAGQPVGGGQLLRGGGGLEVHPEDGRATDGVLAAVVQAVDPVQHRLHLVRVVLHGGGVVAGPVVARGEPDGVAVDLRGEEVLHAVPL